MLPAADFVTVHENWRTFTSLLLLEPLFLDKALIKLQRHANTSLSNPPDEGQVTVSAGHKQTSCVYIFVPLPFVADLVCLHGK